MADPVQINNTDEDTVEIPIGEYEAVLKFSASIAEQNSTVLAALAGIVGISRDVLEQIKTLAARETIIVPPAMVTVESAKANLPAPVVNMTPDVTVNVPAEGPRKIKLTVKRDRNGLISGMEGTVE